jgi:cytochrome P450
MNLDEIDLTQRWLYRQGFPHDLFQTLRDEAPVWRHPETEGFAQAGGEGFWLLSRYEYVRNVNRNKAASAVQSHDSAARWTCL